MACCAWVRLPRRQWLNASVGGQRTRLSRQKAKKGKDLSSCVTDVFYLVMLSTLNVFNCLTKLTDMNIGQMLPRKAGQNLTITNVMWTCNRPSNIHCWQIEGIVYNPHNCPTAINKSVTTCGRLLAIVSVFPHKLKKISHFKRG